MTEDVYSRISQLILQSCRSDIVRFFDDAFLERWERYKKREHGKLLAEAFVIPALSSWFLWYIFKDNTVSFAVLAIMGCAVEHYFRTMKQHKEWELERFLSEDFQEVTQKCLLKCQKIMLEQKREDPQLIAAFIQMQMEDPSIQPSMCDIWLHASKRAR